MLIQALDTIKKAGYPKDSAKRLEKEVSIINNISLIILDLYVFFLFIHNVDMITLNVLLD